MKDFLRFDCAPTDFLSPAHELRSRPFEFRSIECELLSRSKFPKAENSTAQSLLEFL